MPAATAAEVREFVENLGRESLVVIENQMGGTVCRVMGRAVLWVCVGEPAQVGFRWTHRQVNGHLLEKVSMEDSFYIHPCSRNQRATVVFLRVNGGDCYNLCPLRCHRKKGCGLPENNDK